MVLEWKAAESDGSFLNRRRTRRLIRSQGRNIAMADTTHLTALLVAIANRDHSTAVDLLGATPSLAAARLARRDEFFLAERLAQVYEGDTALHAAGFSYDPEMARGLITRGADIRARNRRGAEPLHAAVIGVPGSAGWNPTDQREVIDYLIEVGADPNAAAAGGVTPLHRAVRNRCSAAVEALLRAGADPRLQNDSGSTASDLAHWTTGRGGAGSAEAKTEQRIILDLLQITTE
jgi:ankyrin repeat protein